MASKVYLLWIKYDANAVTAWYCKCKSGARVVGVCAHIASILCYLGYARHNPDIRFGVKHWGTYLKDASDMSQMIDSMIVKVKTALLKSDIFLHKHIHPATIVIFIINM